MSNQTVPTAANFPGGFLSEKNQRQQQRNAERAAANAKRAANAAVKSPTNGNVQAATNANVKAANANVIAAAGNNAPAPVNRAVNATNQAVIANSNPAVPNEVVAQANAVAANANAVAAASPLAAFFGPATKGNNLKSQRNIKVREQANTNSRKILAVNKSANLRTNRQKYTKKANELMGQIGNIRKKIETTPTLSNSNFDGIVEQLDNLITIIAGVRENFRDELTDRLRDFVKKANNTPKTYVYNSGGVTPADPGLYANAIKVTNATIKNYTHIVNAQNFNSNMKNVGLPVFPPIIKMDDILKNYNSAATRIQATQQVNLNNLKKEINRINSEISKNNANMLAKQKKSLLEKLNKIKMAINGTPSGFRVNNTGGYALNM